MQSHPEPEAGEGTSDLERIGARSRPDLTTLQTLHVLLRERRHGEFRDEVARAELAGEIPEFYALDLNALLAMIEGSDLASDYLQLAEAAASSTREQAIIKEHKAAHDWLQADPLTASDGGVDTLEHVYQTEALWNNLLTALDRLGEVESTVAELRSLAQLGDEHLTGLVRLLQGESYLRLGLAFIELLERRAEE